MIFALFGQNLENHLLYNSQQRIKLKLISYSIKKLYQLLRYLLQFWRYQQKKKRFDNISKFGAR